MIFQLKPDLELCQMGAYYGGVIIGLVGPIAVGKGEAVNVLREAGFSTYSLSEEVRREARGRNLVMKREVLVALGNELRTGEPEYFARKTAEQISTDGVGLAVVDGIRNPAEAKYLMENMGLVLVALDAPTDIRLERYLSRNRGDDGKTEEDFYRQDRQDLGVGEASTGQQVAECIRMADYSIKNDGDLRLFEERLLYLISQLWYGQ